MFFFLPFLFFKFWSEHEKAQTYIRSQAGVPNHRAADRHRSVGHLVPGHRERINTLLYFRYIDDHTRKVLLF